MPRFTKVLIANRGEIACRVIRTCRALGYRTVAVYSVADTGSRHVQLADEAVLIGPSPVRESYLEASHILDAAARSGADAVHPGYGFLSENAEFAESCNIAGLVFIGPTADSIRAMGDKAESKRRMIAAGVPCVPGYQGDDQSDENLAAEAERIGFPVMVKASAGGGGRGMRLVHTIEALPAALRGARSEGLNAFGDDRLLLERGLIDARHVELQVFGDTHGQVIHLGERDCSIQRRHQKIVEEAPSPAVDPALRDRMGAAAVKAAAAINYVGAGTVEFLLALDGEFYFLEMNTRLQVEHPVTEFITGLDLVALQLDIASGKPLPFSQSEVTLAGHAIEARLYAEDARNQFLPQTGEVLLWSPAEGASIRVDHGLATGVSISPFYDPMIAKIIAHGADREEARRRLVRAVEETIILGVTTNKEFLLSTLQTPEFVDGNATTGFIGRHFPDGLGSTAAPDLDELALAAALIVERHGAGWQPSAWVAHPLKLRIGDERVQVHIVRKHDAWEIAVNSEVRLIHLLSRTADRIRYAIDDHIRRAWYAIDGSTVYLDMDGRPLEIEDVTLAPAASATGSSGGVLRAPMSGTVIAMDVAPGDAVKRGALLAVLEAMKMEHQICASIDGIVDAVSVGKGQQVAARDILITIQPSAA